MTEEIGAHPATLFDGVSARRHQVAVKQNAGGLVIVFEEGEADSVPFADLKIAAPPNRNRIIKPKIAGWRLDFVDAIPADIASHLSKEGRYGGLIDKIGLWPAAAGFAAVSACAVLAAYMAPAIIAPLISYETEKQIGQGLVGDMAYATCHTKEGDAALAKLLRQIGVAKEDKITIQMVKTMVPNAAALPGNRMVVFSGILRLTEDPDSLAGVLAHEYGHIKKRHVMQALIRELGISTIFAASSGSAPQQLLQAGALKYSRDAEEEADRFAIEQLGAANISTESVAEFFKELSLGEPEGEWFDFFSTHPQSAKRAKKFAAEVKKGHSYKPALSEGEWNAIVDMCSLDEKAKELFEIDGF